MPDEEYINSARKEHQCSWCGQLISIATSYIRYRYFEPEIGTAKLHPECDTAMMEAYSKGLLENGEEYYPEWPRGCYHDPADKYCNRCRKDS